MNENEVKTIIEEKLKDLKSKYFIIPKTGAIGTIVTFLVAVILAVLNNFQKIQEFTPDIENEIEKARSLIKESSAIHEEIENYASQIKSTDIPSLISEFESSEVGRQYLKKSEFKWNKIAIDNDTFSDSLEYMFVVTFASEGQEIKVGNLYFVDAVFPSELSTYTNDHRFLVKKENKNELYYQGSKIGAIELYGRTLLK